MPELPEVQCVINTLQRMVGKTFVACSILNDVLREPVQADLPDRVISQKIVSICRQGKYILIQLSRGYLVCHLGMTGKLVINASLGKHDRLVFRFEDGTSLTYNDVRKFGFVTFEVHPGDSKYLRNLGVEPLSDGFTADVLLALCERKRVPIKVLLLDQGKIAGLGNIYVNEVLYQCRISPFLEAREISLEQCQQLVPAIKRMLELSIRLGGSSISDYRDADDKKGSFQDTFCVYGRKEDPEGRPVVRSTQGGRSTFHVPALQGDWIPA